MNTKNIDKYFGTKKAVYACGGFLAFAAATCLFPELVLAIPKGPETLKGVAEVIQDEVQGSGLTIAMNAVGIASVGYSLFNNLSKGPLVGGVLILGFANAFFPYINAAFK